MLLKDVARECGLDISTVSRALRDDPRVKPETARYVKATADKLGYQPNLAARFLAAGSSRTIWFLLPSLSQIVEQKPAEAASRYLSDLGWDTLIAVHRSDSKIYNRLLSRLSSGVTDGAVIIGGEKWKPSTLKKLADRGYPVIFLDRPSETLPLPAVSTDNRAATTALAHRALENGARIFIDMFIETNSVAKTRSLALREFGRKNAIPVITDPFRRTGTDQFPGENGKMIAVFASDQNRVSSLLNAVPDITRRTLVFAVFDAWIGSIAPARSILVCRQDFTRMAESAVDLILEQIRTKTLPAPLTLIPPLEVRAYTEAYSVTE